MFTTTIINPAAQRAFQMIGAVFSKALMVAGLILIVGLIGVQAVHGEVTGVLKQLLAPAGVNSDASPELGGDAMAASMTANTLSPQMQSALQFVSRRYRVAGEALQPVFEAAQTAGRDLHLDPLLIIAVIGVESRFNPFSQSVYGAQGLMQVVPRFHIDKLPEQATAADFLDPVINVRVGATALRQFIARSGSLEEGLQQFGGAANDPEQRYAAKVLAEKSRLEQVATAGNKV
ncbi:MAG: transglycosylase SLT domain-containing protein [Azonexus sp.]|jgi:hypothetical protein|nr:transglycosylase SLT domain-containing protein [Azonexus sp.]